MRYLLISGIEFYLIRFSSLDLVIAARLTLGLMLIENNSKMATMPGTILIFLKSQSNKKKKQKQKSNLKNMHIQYIYYNEKDSRMIKRQ